MTARLLIRRESMENKECPCAPVKDLQRLTREQEKRLSEGSVNFAVINAKLNIVMGILGCIGAAVASVIVKMVF